MWWTWYYEQTEKIRRDEESANTNKQIEVNIANAVETLATDNEFIAYLSSKIKRKEEIKKASWEDDWSNDWAEWKRLWIFILNIQLLPKDLVQIVRSNNIDIYWDEVWELHIPFQDISISEVSESMKRLKEYLRSNKDKVKLPKYLYWITYLSDISNRYWFNVIDLPNSIRSRSWAARLLETYKNDPRNPKRQKIARRFKVEDIKLCYISVERLLRLESEISTKWFENRIKDLLRLWWWNS